MKSAIFRRIFAEDGRQNESGEESVGVPLGIFEKQESQKRFKRHSGTRFHFEKFKFGSATALSHFVTEFTKCHNMSQNFRQGNFVTECHHVTGNPFSALGTGYQPLSKIMWICTHGSYPEVPSN